MVRLNVLAFVLGIFFASSADAQVEVDSVWSTNGRIEDSDSPVGNYRTDQYRFHLEAGRRYRFRADSSDFDIFLELARGADGPALESDDDSGGGTNAFLVHAPTESGTYHLRVRPLGAEGRGVYSVRVEASQPVRPPSRAAASQRMSHEWQIWNGELDVGDSDRDGRLFEDLLVTFGAGETRLISAESDAFDPIVWVLRDAGENAEPLDFDDDAGPGFNALLGFHADVAGDYVVRVMAFEPGTRGRYQLRISGPISPAIIPGSASRPPRP